MDLINIILHLDKYIPIVIHEYHNLFYVIFFLVIFCETGLVVMPFLPGDSLLFVAGTLASTGEIKFSLLILVIFIAAFLGDSCNFYLGKYFGKKLFKQENSKLFRKDLLDKTHNFYQKHGFKAIIIARFIPLVRTFAPFVAGIGQMAYSKFIGFSLLASAMWVAIFVCGGYFFGNLPFIKAHLSLVILVVMVISILPIIKTLLQAKIAKNHN